VVLLFVNAAASGLLREATAGNPFQNDARFGFEMRRLGRLLVMTQFNESVGIDGNATIKLRFRFI
jgi:hypothetical protein